MNCKFLWQNEKEYERDDTRIEKLKFALTVVKNITDIVENKTTDKDKCSLKTKENI